MNQKIKEKWDKIMKLLETQYDVGIVIFEL